MGRKTHFQLILRSSIASNWAAIFSASACVSAIFLKSYYTCKDTGCWFELLSKSSPTTCDLWLRNFAACEPPVPVEPSFEMNASAVFCFLMLIFTLITNSMDARCLEYLFYVVLDWLTFDNHVVRL